MSHQPSSCLGLRHFWIFQKTPGRQEAGFKLEAPDSWGLREKAQRPGFLCALSSLWKCMECVPVFVLDLVGAEGGAYFDSWSRGLAPRISGRLFFCCTIPWEMRSCKLRGGKWVEKGEARGKGGVPAITLLTSQFSTVACPAYLCWLQSSRSASALVLSQPRGRRWEKALTLSPRTASIRERHFWN